MMETRKSFEDLLEKDVTTRYHRGHFAVKAGTIRSEEYFENGVDSQGRPIVERLILYYLGSVHVATWSCSNKRGWRIEKD